MRAYRKYVQQLEVLNKAILSDPNELLNSFERVKLALNGEPSSALRTLISVAERRTSGAFFTPKYLADIAIEPLRSTIGSDSVVVDLACGVGDLLLSCMEDSDVPATTSEKLQQWGKVFVGRDIHPEFIYAAKWRLLLSLLTQSKDIDIDSSVSVSDIFPSLQVGDGLDFREDWKKVTHVLLNPPFVRVPAPINCDWGSGSVSQAAIFLDKCISEASTGTRIVAILPDVLRSGSLYRKWRTKVAARTNELRCELMGQFDRWADVHVFILDLEVVDSEDTSARDRWNLKRTSRRIIGQDFEIRIGTVVDYRDEHIGPSHHFVKPSDVVPWQSMNTFSRKRRFEGRVFSPPFVVVRRTSRVEDKHRAIATIIGGDEPVAVENHFIVLLPRTGTSEECKSLLTNLKHENTSEWLNSRIRCRHLTISSLRDLPWW